jgi:LPXTG-motif cell wall-anchored protein
MNKHLLGLELAHWLIIAGSALVVLGLLGMIVRRRKQLETPARRGSITR